MTVQAAALIMTSAAPQEEEEEEEEEEANTFADPTPFALIRLDRFTASALATSSPAATARRVEVVTVTTAIAADQEGPSVLIANAWKVFPRMRTSRASAIMATTGTGAASSPKLPWKI